MTRWGYLSLALVLASFGLAGYAHLNADAIPGGKIPIHWNIHGEPDGWASPDQPFLAFYLLPTMLGGVVALGLFALPWLSPRNFAVEGFRQTYDYVFFLVAALFLYLGGIITWSQFHGPLHLERTLLAGIFLFFALLGNVLGKVKRNFWMGVRTPWTLADPVVWDRTHRVAAWLFVATGVAGAVLALLGVHPAVCFVLLMVGALSPIVYSLVLYKRLEREGKLESQQQAVTTVE
ncbi:MAG TPA: SdpI family protein [Gemmataceae bacterium]|jgi:uncharacterized membrane protein